MGGATNINLLRKSGFQSSVIKTKTKAINLANDDRRKQRDEPIRI